MFRTKLGKSAVGLAVVIVLLAAAGSVPAEVGSIRGAGQKKERHPCVVCSREELTGLKARVRSQKDPYKFWRSKLKGGAGWDGAISSAFSAMLYLGTGDRNYRDSAAKALLGVSGESWSKWAGGGKDWGLDASRDFMMILRGYDLMKGMGALTKEEDARIRDALYQKANELYFLFDQIGVPNNHELRGASSLGVAGMVLADYKVKDTKKPEIIFKSGFEEAASTGWKPTKTTKGFKQEFGVSQKSAHSGKGSLAYRAPSTWCGYRSPDLKLKRNIDYTLTFWIRGDKKKPDGYMRLDLVVPNHNPTLARPRITNEWTKYSISFRIPRWAKGDLKNCYLQFSQATYSGANWYIDDVSLQVGRPKTTPADWMVKAEKNIKKIIVDRKLIAPGDLTYFEGPGYAGYTYELLIPFLRTYRVFAGREHAIAPLVYGSLKRTALLRRPWGAAPNVDDADGGYSRLWFCANDRSKLHDGAFFRWIWQTGQAKHYKTSVLYNDLAEEFANFAAKGKVSPPKVRSVLGPKYHYQIFRSDWKPSAVYMLLQSKHYPGKASHCQCDTGSFLIDAFGTDLAIDCGYGGWGNANRTRFYRKPVAHNLILVNGKGPTTTTPAEVGSSLAGESADYTEMSMKYGDASITRRVLFPAHRYFVIADTVEAEKSADCDWLLHSPGMETKVSGNGISWTNGKAGLFVRFAAPVRMQRKVDKRRAPSPKPPGGVERTGDVDHAYFLCRRSGTKVSYLTLLFPIKEGQEKPGVETHQGEGFFALRVKFDGVEDVIIFSQVKSASWGGITTTGRLAMVRLGGKGKFVFIRGPGGVSVAGKTIISLKTGSAARAIQ